MPTLDSEIHNVAENSRQGEKIDKVNRDGILENDNGSRGFDPGFAPADLTDGRKPGDWKTRYPEKEARRAICFEAIYITSWFIVCPIMFVIIWLGALKKYLGLSDDQSEVLCRYAYGWFGGLMGGTMYSLKWLYHSVAHWCWNRDRRLWRLCTPHVSAALAFVFVCLIQCGLFPFFDQSFVRQPSVILTIAFLVGFFSDNAFAKLSEIAMKLFGTRDSNKEP